MRKFMVQNVIALISTLASLILGITLYAYSQDQKMLHSKITTETIERKEDCNSIRKELNKKVNKDAFEEFKAGQTKILETINDAQDREHIYQEIIKELTFIKVDTNNYSNEIRLTGKL